MVFEWGACMRKLIKSSEILDQPKLFWPVKRIFNQQKKSWLAKTKNSQPRIEISKDQYFYNFSKGEFASHLIFGVTFGLVILKTGS